MHGPLLATLLADLVRHSQPQRPLARFSFRAVRPTLELHPFRIGGRLLADGSQLQAP